MIVKINKQYMAGAVLKTNDPPVGFNFFPAFDAGANVFCEVSDTSQIAVPFTVVNLPDQALANAKRMVGLHVLQEYGLPEGQP